MGKERESQEGEEGCEAFDISGIIKKLEVEDSVVRVERPICPGCEIFTCPPRMG